MRSRKLGRDGPEVAFVGLGCNNFGGRVDLEGTRSVVDAALDVGVNFFDTADIYGNCGGSESFLGEVLQGRRDRVVLATKFGMDMGDGQTARGARAYIRGAIEGSLKRLQTDYVDLYQYHRPDEITPIEETLETLDELVRAGKVRYIGNSNFTAAQIEHADETARTLGLTAFVSAQNEYSLLEREVEHDVLPMCARLGLGFLPFFPLASGLLTGKYRRGGRPPRGSRLAYRDERLSDEAFDRVEALERFAAQRELTVLQVAIGGLAAQPAVTSVIAGATNPDQVRQNAEAGDWEPSVADLAELDGIR